MRLDKYISRNKSVESRSKAVQLVKKEEVLVDGEVESDKSYEVGPKQDVELKSRFKYVSRGGYKIEKVFKEKDLKVKGKRILDVGCSNGGFTDFFIQEGAERVISIDIANDILDESLQRESRVEWHGEVDATNTEELEEAIDGEFDLISVDLTDVPLQVVLNKLKRYLKPSGVIIALFKPHYQGGKGVVPEEERKKLMKEFEEEIEKDLKVVEKLKSPLRGGSKNRGNQELFYLLKPCF